VALSALKTIFAIVATAALSYFAPGIGTAIASQLGLTSAFLGAVIGAAVLAVGLFAIQTLLMPSQRGAEIDAGKINVRVTEPIRWICAGRARQGGGVLFADFDSMGNLWYLIVHADSILTSTVQVMLDDVLVTLDGSGIVQNKEFRLKDNKEKDPATSDGEGVGYVQIWTTTHTETDPTPPGVAALTAALPQWTTEHRLVGTTYSVVKMSAIPIEHRQKIYRWRGALGLGEPAISIVGEWSNVYDPRDVAQTLGDRTTYAPTNNPVLIWAWFRTHRYGRKKAESSVNWTRVAEQATICDQIVTGIEGDVPRYECGIGIPENKQRIAAEQEIMLTMDAQLVFDEDGKCWPRAGAYYAPTLSFSRNRDIVAMESVEAQNGESETQGVIVRYSEPSANYSPQPSAAWYNPLYYVPGETPTFLTVDILGCQNHNQALRLAKAIGMRSQPIHKIVPMISLRGLRARQERIITLNYDNTFAGEYEIVTQVEVDGAGIFCGMGLVPVDEDRWTLLPGEETAKSETDSSNDTTVPELPDDVAFSYNNARIEGVFTPSARVDVYYQFQFIKTDDFTDTDADIWFDMTVSAVNGLAYSGPVEYNTDYTLRYRSITGSGRVSDWSDPYDTLTVFVTGGPLQVAIYNSWIVEVAAGVPVVTIAADGTLTIDDHTRRYSDGFPDVEVTGDVIATGLTDGDGRAIAYDDVSRLGGAVVYSLYEDDNDAHVSAANPGRHYIGFFTVPATGTSDGGGGGIPGGSCVAVYESILLANAALDGPGEEIEARYLRVGNYVWTQHEFTLEWGAYPVEVVTFVRSTVWEADGYPDATANHRFMIDGEWIEMGTFGTLKRDAVVAKITVRDAHTYVSNGALSHNIKDNPI
jgi:hypothetical protein